MRKQSVEQKHVRSRIEREMISVMRSTGFSAAGDSTAQLHAVAERTDAVVVLLEAAATVVLYRFQTHSLEFGPLHSLERFLVATYDRPFSVQDKDAITSNMLYIGQVKNGAITFAYPEDARRNLIVQRKQ